MEKFTIAIFGEAEKGAYHAPHLCRTLEQLDGFFGNPPEGSQGLYYAVQTLMFDRDLLFFRVREEGFSTEDYLLGIRALEKQDLIQGIAAICTPGVGDETIIKAIHPLCEMYHSILITNEADFYDYLTNK